MGFGLAGRASPLGVGSGFARANHSGIQNSEKIDLITREGTAGLRGQAMLNPNLPSARHKKGKGDAQGI